MGRKKRFENLLQIIGGDALAVVADLEKRPLRAVANSGVQIDDWLTVRVTQSVFTKVPYDLMELAGIHLYLKILRLDVNSETVIRNLVAVNESF